MTTENPVINYDSQGVGVTCPLCYKRPIMVGSKKKIYGHGVCKKCYYAFANRRQLAYLIDAVLISIVNFGAGFVLGFTMIKAGYSTFAINIAAWILSLPFTLLFIFKDGFRGQSPGKFLTNVQVVDDGSGQPAGFTGSFKRNLPLMLGCTPVVGSFLTLVVIIIIAIQMLHGYRLGDGWAHTRVIWKKFANRQVFGGNALVCESCGYDLQGNASGRCPECGTPVSERNKMLLSSAPAPVSAAPQAIT